MQTSPAVLTSFDGESTVGFVPLLNVTVECGGAGLSQLVLRAMEFAAVERMRRTFCRNLCQRTFRHWESLWVSSFEADTHFAYADYSDGVSD